jgi:nitroreductase
MDFIELARLRRSVRRFENRPVEPEKIAELMAIAERAAVAFDARDAALLVVDDPAKADLLRKTIVSGWAGKINVWIYATAFPAVLILLGRPDADPPADDRPFYLARASLLMETAVLAAAEMGLGTCWMAGFNEANVAKALGLPPAWRPIIVSPLGHPAAKGRLENVSRSVAQSDRRVPLEEIYDIRGGQS